MNKLLQPVSRQTAIAAVRTPLPARLRASTDYSYLYRGSEGKSLMAQARQSQRWYSCFHTMNRRAQPMSIDAPFISPSGQSRPCCPLLTELLAAGEQENPSPWASSTPRDEYIQVQLVV